MKREVGFTLIELTAALAIMLIALMMVAPNYSLLVKNNRLVSHGNSFVLAINLARNEAIKRRFNIVVCPTADGATCSATGKWEQGWLLVLDNDGSDDQSAGDVVLKVFPALPGDALLRALTPSAYVTSIIYRPTGFTSTSGQFVICDDRGLELARAVEINLAGHPQLMKNSDMTIPFVDCTGGV